MARYAVKKINSQGRVIKDFKAWKKLHPDTLYHDSRLEYNFYQELTKRKIVFEYQVTYTLQERFTFLDWCVRSVKKIKVLDWYQCSILPITWTPDFKVGGVVIEAKGRANDRFANILKMFKNYVRVNNLNLKVVVLYSVKELIEFIDNGGLDDR